MIPQTFSVKLPTDTLEGFNNQVATMLSNYFNQRECLVSFELVKQLETLSPFSKRWHRFFKQCFTTDVVRRVLVFDFGKYKKSNFYALREEPLHKMSLRTKIKMINKLLESK